MPIEQQDLTTRLKYLTELAQRNDAQIMLARARTLFNQTSEDPAQTQQVITTVLDLLPPFAKDHGTEADDLVSALFKANTSTEELLAILPSVNEANGYVARGITDRLFQREGLAKPDDKFVCQSFAFLAKPHDPIILVTLSPSSGHLVATTFNGLTDIPEDHVLNLRHDIANGPVFTNAIQKRKNTAIPT